MNTACLDCGVDTVPDDEREPHQYYMVANGVWALAGAGRGMLCVDCLELRLGRPLIGADLTDAPINVPSSLDTPRLHALKQAMVRPQDALELIAKVWS